VKDILMPLLGLLIGPKGFRKFLCFSFKDVDAARSANPNLSLEEAGKIGNVLAWGDFVTVVIDFLIIAFFVLMVVKRLNRLSMSKGIGSVIEGIKKD